MKNRLFCFLLCALALPVTQAQLVSAPIAVSGNQGSQPYESWLLAQSQGVPLSELVPNEKGAKHENQVQNDAAGDAHESESTTQRETKRTQRNSFTLVSPAVNPEELELSTAQKLALLEEAQRNRLLAQQLQGEPQKMVLERNTVISEQLFKAEKLSQARMLSQSLMLRVRPMQNPDIVQVYEEKMDWSGVNPIIRWLGQTFWNKHYPKTVSVQRKRNYGEIQLIDRQSGQVFPFHGSHQIKVTRSGEPIPLIKNDNGQTALIAWTEQFGQNNIEITLKDAKLPEFGVNFEQSYTLSTLDERVDQIKEDAQLTNSQSLITWTVLFLIALMIVAIQTYVVWLATVGYRYRKAQAISKAPQIGKTATQSVK